MSKLITLLLSFFFLLSHPIFAQNFLDKVKLEELEEVSSSSFLKAKAVVLNEEIQVEFDYDYEYGFRVKETVSRKIKLYDISAKEQLSFVIPYAPKGFSKEDVVITVSNIYSIIGGEIVKVKAPKESLVDEDKGNWREKKVSYSNIKAGDIVEYSYTKSTSYIDELPEWYIQSDLPKEKATYKVMVPEYFTYSVINRGHVKLSEQEFTKHVSFRGINGSFSTTEVKSIFKVFSAQFIPAYVVEPYIDNPNNYMSSVRFDLQQVQFSHGPLEKVMPSEKEFYADLLKNRGFGSAMKQDKFLKKELDIEDYKNLTVDQKVSKIMGIVQSRVKWNNEYSVFIEQGIKSAYFKGGGNGADINLLLNTMLRYVGVKANPVLLSTRSNGVKAAWQRNFYNHVIVAVEVNQQIYLVDAINPNSVLNILPTEDLSGEGTIVYEDGKIVKINLLPRFVSSLNKKFLMTPGVNGIVTGQVIENYNNYEALNFRSMYDGSEWRLGKWFESQYFGLKINEIKVYDTKDNTKDVRVVYSFSKADGVVVFNNKLFIRPFQFYPLFENPFKQSARLNPIYFGYPELGSYQVAINIPEGYQASELPKGVSIKALESGLELQTKFDRKENQILCSLVFIKTKGVIGVMDYQEVKAIYNDLIEQLQLQVELEKK